MMVLCPLLTVVPIKMVPMVYSMCITGNAPYAFLLLSIPILGCGVWWLLSRS